MHAPTHPSDPSGKSAWPREAMPHDRLPHGQAATAPKSLQLVAIVWGCGVALAVHA